MSTDYAGATINNVVSKGNAKAVQDMIGIPRAAGAGTPALTQMQNGHIGGAQTAAAVTPATAAEKIAANLTTGLNNLGAVWTWKTATGLWGV